MALYRGGCPLPEAFRAPKTRNVDAWVAFGLAVALLLIATLAYDLLQRRHAILRNFPLVGHLRYILEAFGPELRQYIVTSNQDERPFNRDQRRWVYASAKREDNHFGFGTSQDVEHTANYLIVKQSAFPLPRPRPGEDTIPCAKVVGAARGRRQAFRPASVVNLSAMSYGALSARATEACNRGCALAGSLHNTGEGGVSRYHRHGADLVYQIGTGYFGCRDRHGRFDLPRLVEAVSGAPVRAIEIKLSQGAKPGIGGMLPGAKVTPEIAEARGVPVGQDCISPSAHTAFSDPDGLLDLVEKIADATGLPVGIKSAVGDLGFWYELTALMKTTSRGVDFVTIDGGEGGTGAAPLVFADHVALPFKIAMSKVYPIFVDAGLHESVTFVGAGKLGFPETALLGFALGCDMVNVAREAMMAVGCVQAQRCQTGRCPAGVATQSAWLARGLDPDLKGRRLANYLHTLRREILELTRACGVPHPSLVTADMFEILDGRFGSVSGAEVFGYDPSWGLPSAADATQIAQIMSAASTRSDVGAAA